MQDLKNYGDGDFRLLGVAGTLLPSNSDHLGKRDCKMGLATSPLPFLDCLIIAESSAEHVEAT